MTLALANLLKAVDDALEQLDWSRHRHLQGTIIDGVVAVRREDTRALVDMVKQVLDAPPKPPFPPSLDAVGTNGSKVTLVVHKP